MHMKMRHFLTAIPANIGNHSIPALGDAGEIRHMGNHAGEGGLLIGTCGGSKVAPVDIRPFRDHKNMNGAQRIDVLKG